MFVSFRFIKSLCLLTYQVMIMDQKVRSPRCQAQRHGVIPMAITRVVQQSERDCRVPLTGSGRGRFHWSLERRQKAQRKLSNRKVIIIISPCDMKAPSNLSFKWPAWRKRGEKCQRKTSRGQHQNIATKGSESHDKAGEWLLNTTTDFKCNHLGVHKWDPVLLYAPVTWVNN